MNQNDFDAINTALNGAGIAVNASILVEQLASTQSTFNQLNAFADYLKCSNAASLDPIHCHREILKLAPNCSHFKQSLPMLGTNECLTAKDVNVILGEIQQSQAKIANGIVGLSVIVAVITIAAQAYQLAGIWQVLSQARNVTRESQETLKQMEINLKFIKNSIAEIQPWINDYQTVPEADENYREYLIRKINFKYIEIRQLYGASRNQLSELRLEINGKYHSFRRFHRSRVRNMAVNSVFIGAQFGSVFAQLVMFSAVLNPFMIVAAATVTVGLGLVTIASVATLAISKNTLKKLFRQLDEIDQLQLKLIPLNGEIIKIQKWLDENDISCFSSEDIDFMDSILAD